MSGLAPEIRKSVKGMGLGGDGIQDYFKRSESEVPISYPRTLVAQTGMGCFSLLLCPWNLQETLAHSR